jgi:hypothetical protein
MQEPKQDDSSLIDMSSPCHIQNPPNNIDSRNSPPASPIEVEEDTSDTESSDNHVPQSIQFEQRPLLYYHSRTNSDPQPVHSLLPQHHTISHHALPVPLGRIPVGMNRPPPCPTNTTSNTHNGTPPLTHPPWNTRQLHSTSKITGWKDVQDLDDFLARVYTSHCPSHIPAQNIPLFIGVSIL